MMQDLEYIPIAGRNALIVHPDIGVLSAIQSAVAKEGFTPVVSRDLPTALLAMAQHRFDLCVLAVGISEKSDGWALAAVLHMCFPHAYIAMLAPEPDLLMLQTAINTGVTQLYVASCPAAEVASDILRDCSRQPKGSKLQ
jgi:DNA-binding NtrC family response regulator